MKPLITLSLAACLAASTACAEDDAPGLMERGMQLFMEGLMQEMEPALKDLQGLADDMGPAMRDFVQNMGPALRELLEKVEDWSVYHPPEILPNGDIILRKKTPAEQAIEDPVEI